MSAPFGTAVDTTGGAMSRYAVRIVGPAGRVTYLTADFNETQHESAAKTYRAIEDAEANGRIFRQERRGNFIWDTVNLDDPEDRSDD